MKSLVIMFLFFCLTSNLYSANFSEGDCYKSKIYDENSYYAEVIQVTKKNYLIVGTKLKTYDRTVKSFPIDEVDKHMVKIECPKLKN